jgi:hypothetical protein
MRSGSNVRNLQICEKPSRMATITCRLKEYRCLRIRWTTENVIKCLSHGACGAQNDIRAWLDKAHDLFDHECRDAKWNFIERHVQIAVFNGFADNMTAGWDKSDERMWLLGSHCYEDGLQRAMSWHYRRMGSSEFPTTSLRITTRMALLSAVERQSYIKRPPFTHTIHYQEGSDKPSLYMGTDEPIETEEWEDIWAEGERVMTARELAQRGGPTGLEVLSENSCQFKDEPEQT